MIRPCRLPVALAILMLLVGIGTASACDPAMIDRAIEEADAHLSFVMRSGDLEAARAHLRRVARAMNEAEAQFISCNCQNAPFEAASTAAEARRAAAAQDFADLAISVDATVTGFQLTLLAMQDDLCR